jgi:hypothetical protein
MVSPAEVAPRSHLRFSLLSGDEGESSLERDPYADDGGES